MSRKRDLHADEASFGHYHYSAVLYLSTQREDFEGGRFVFSDGHDAPVPGAEMVDGRVLSPFEPAIGSAVAFSSGWENMHFVEPTTGGCRFALPAFFTTEPPMEPPGQLQNGGRHHYHQDADDRAIADTLWQSLFMPETEDDFAYFMENWHALLARGARGGQP